MLRFIKNIYLISALLIPTFSSAHDIGDKILCSSLNIIQQSSQKIDTAQKINNEYIVYTATSPYQTNNLWWFVGVGDVYAATSDEAVTKGKEIVQKASIQRDVYATKQGDEFICNYGPGYIQARGKNLSSAIRKRLATY